MFPTKKNPSIHQLRDSLGGCHQRHRYLAARRSFGPQTGLMAVLRCGAALPVLVVDDEISGVPTSFNRIPSLQRICCWGLV